MLAVGTIFEAAIEGVSLGVATAIGSGLTLPLAVAVAINNLSEGLSLAVFSEEDRRGAPAGRALRWATGIGATTVLATLVGWFFLRGVSPAVHAGVFAAGAACST